MAAARISPGGDGDVWDGLTDEQLQEIVQGRGVPYLPEGKNNPEVVCLRAMCCVRVMACSRKRSGMSRRGDRWSSVRVPVR